MLLKEKSSQKSFNLDIHEIVRAFFEKSTEDQVDFIKSKIEELIILEDAKLNLINRIKRHFLVQRRYLGIILNGLLYQAEKFRENL